MEEITPRRLFVVILFLILLVATGLRLYRLPELPLGLHYDEAANGILAGEIARGVKTPIFIPSYTGKEVLFFYWTALWMKLLGATPLALRLSAALAGVATVVATVWAAREMLRGVATLPLDLEGRRDADWVALLTGAFLATSFWHLILSRYGFRAVTQPLMQALTVGALWRGLSEERGDRRRRSVFWLILGGLCCGLTAYTYLAARAFPIPLVAALLTLLVADRGRRRLRQGQLALFVAVAALTLAPLAYYWLTHPGSFLNRTQQVAAASWAEAWAGFRACLGMFFLRGDPGVRFNLPRRPLFDPVTAVLFLLGIVVLFKSQITGRKSSSDPLHLASCVFLLTLLPIMLLPSALAPDGIPPSNLRTVGLLPFIYVFPALALSSLKSRISVLRPSSLVILVLILSGFFTASIYFDQWAVSAELYYAADGDLADAATYLDQADLTATTPYVASIHYRHPTLAFLSENYEAIRWLTGGQTVVFPEEGDALLIFPRSASEERVWGQSVLPDESLVAAPAGPDGAPAFHVYRASSASNLTPTHPLTADLAHIALVLGYDVVGEPRSGERAEVAVWWRVLNVPDRGDYGPVARLTDPWGFAWGTTQPFHYPSEQWTPGEVIVDRLSIPVASGAPPGDYLVHFSLYSASADASLLALDDAGRYAGTGVELPLRLERAAAPPDPDDLDIRTRLDARADGLTLLGANLDTSADTARPGERLYLTLFWRADETPLTDYDVYLSLDETMLYAGAPVHGTYPTSAWSAGEVVVDRYDLRLPLDTPSGDHPLPLQLGDLALDLGNITVETTERTFEVPPISHPLTATLGDQVELLGYDLSAEAIAPGDTLTLTLYWRALTEMDEEYTVFTHLLAPDGSMTGQRDSYPLGGAYPITLWAAGEVVADVYEIPIRADAAPGAHRLEVGMYVAETGARLPVVDTAEDALVLQAVTVVGNP